MNYFFPDKYFEYEKDGVFLTVETFLKDYQKTKKITISKIYTNELTLNKEITFIF